MTIEQTVEIPANHRLTLEVPREIPAGKAVIAFTPVPAPQPAREVSSLRSLKGIDRGRDTMEAYFKRHWADKAKEDRPGEADPSVQ
jgi:hypothetical protein